MWFVFVEPVLPGKSASVDWKLVDPMKIMNLRKADSRPVMSAEM